MPKSPRVSNIENLRHNPLAEDYSPSYSFKQKAPKKRKLRQDDEDDHDPEQVVDAKSSRKILSAAQDLANEEESERTARYVSSKNDAFNLDDRLRLEPEEEDEPEGHDEEWHDDENHDVEIEEADPHDLDVFNKFNPPAFDDPILNTGSDPIENQSRNLADIILEKIAQHEAGETENALPEDMLEDEMVVLPPKVVEVYTKYVCHKTKVNAPLTTLQNRSSSFPLQIRKAP
jgi:essential nuclear protein 1